MCTDPNVTVEADFVVIGEDWGLYYVEKILTRKNLSLLRIGIVHSVNNLRIETTEQRQQNITGK